jgi:eukaryotic-like serine/threonine-protein kinase
LKEVAAVYVAEDGEWEAFAGNCQQTRPDVTNAFAIARNRIAQFRGAVGLALCGEVAQAQSVSDELAQRYPKDTLINECLVPTIRAAIEVNRGSGGQAIHLLQATSRFEMGVATRANLWPTTIYVRGLAYLRQGTGSEAEAEFQKILEHRGINSISPLYALAHLGLARAAALKGDTAKSRTAYQDFFALWKDADPDIPILKEAKQEYEKLK